MAGDAERLARLRFLNDLGFYCRKCLKIRTKAASVVPLVLNSAQLYLHNMLEEQKRTTGKVRALVCKGRQQGCSTYVQARFYHRLTHSQGTQAFILTHED